VAKEIILQPNCVRIPFILFIQWRCARSLWDDQENSLTFHEIFQGIGGPGSSDGIATGYGAVGSGDRIPVGARFPAPVQTGPGAHLASCTRGTGSFPEVKSCRGVTLTSHPLLLPWSRKSRAIPLLPLRAYGLYRASVPVQGCNFPFVLKEKLVVRKLSLRL
jgi:hypothetical protein